MQRIALFYLAAIAAVWACCAPAKAGVTVQGLRGGNRPVFTRPGVYDYAPTVMWSPSDKIYRMWWCGGIAGDHILHAQSTSLGGPWHAHNSTKPNSFDDTFAPTLNKKDWDGEQVCDPSVIKVAGTYYLYYGGLPLPGSSQPRTTSLGVATGKDGLSWKRASDNPVVRPAQSISAVPNKYGAGQPSVYFLDGWFHMAFTDTSGFGADRTNGAGIFVWRSKSGTFATDVQELQSAGWVARNPKRYSTWSVQEGYGIDWAYSHVLRRTVLAISAAGGIAVRTLGADWKQKRDIAFTIPAAWHDGPGLVRTAYGHLPDSWSPQVVPIDVLRAVTDASGNNSPNGWDIAHVGQDMRLP